MTKITSQVCTMIADDEALARQRLRERLRQVAWIDLVGETDDGPATVTEVDRLKPDLLFLDIHMPGLSGLAVLERLTHRPHVVFTTAHDRYAVAAFELQALDYLLKPVSRRRFEAALERVKQTLQIAPESTVERGRAALRRGTPLSRIFVRRAGKIVPVSVEEITRFEADDDYVRIHTTAGDRYLASLRMQELESQLDNERFLRIHRSHIVNLDRVSSFDSHPSGRLRVTMSDGIQLFASRSKSQELRKLAV